MILMFQHKRVGLTRMTPSEVDRLIASADGDGMIDFWEFQSMLKHN